LRGVRRRLRNKMAAQESRKRKKEHLATLEERLVLVFQNHIILYPVCIPLDASNSVVRTPN